VKNASHEWIGVNKAFSELMGHPKSDLVGSSDRAIISAELAAEREAEDAQVIRTGHLLVTEQNQIHADGSLRILRKRKAMVTFPDGRLGVVGILTDITQEKLAQRDVQNSRTLLDAVMSAVPVPVTVKDGGGRFIFVNGPATEFFARPQADFIGKHVNGGVKASHVAAR